MPSLTSGNARDTITPWKRLKNEPRRFQYLLLKLFIMVRHTKFLFKRQDSQRISFSSIKFRRYSTTSPISISMSDPLQSHYAEPAADFSVPVHRRFLIADLRSSRRDLYILPLKFSVFPAMAQNIKRHHRKRNIFLLPCSSL